MTKRQLIDDIVSINQSAAPAFLAQFSDADLEDYLRHLHWLQAPRLVSRPERYAKFLKRVPTAAASQPVGKEPDSPLFQDADSEAQPLDEPAPVDDLNCDTLQERSDDSPHEPAHAMAASPVGSSLDTDTPFAESREESESWLF